MSAQQDNSGMGFSRDEGNLGMDKANRFLESKFIQICLAPENSYWQGGLLALDNCGVVWSFNQLHEVWQPMAINRGLSEPVKTIPAKIGRKFAEE